MQQEQISLGISEDPRFSVSAVKEALTPYEPTPNDPPWTTPLAFLNWFSSIFLLFFFGTVPILIYALSQNIGKEQFGDFIQTPRAILIGVAGTIPAHIITLMICWYVATGRGEFSPGKTLGAKWGGFNLGYCLLSVIFFYIIFGTLLYNFGSEDTELTKILTSSKAAVYMIAFLAVVTAPIVEEIVHRGILYSALQRSAGVPWAIFITSFLFAGIHFLQYRQSWVAILMISMLSLGLTLIRWRSKNILPCIVTHFLFNGIQAAALLLQPDSPVPAPENVSALIRFFY
jgi:membrane protease YdiL (CAAX protease family)